MKRCETYSWSTMSFESCEHWSQQFQLPVAKNHQTLDPPVNWISATPLSTVPIKNGDNSQLKTVMAKYGKYVATNLKVYTLRTPTRHIACHRINKLLQTFRMTLHKSCVAESNCAIANTVGHFQCMARASGDMEMICLPKRKELSRWKTTGEHSYSTQCHTQAWQLNEKYYAAAL